MPAIPCPRCKKENDAPMAFCIFCGGDMKPAAAIARDTEPAPQTAPSAKAPPVVCPSCEKSDPLNGRFCVLCGAEIAVVAIQATAQAAKIASPGIAATRSAGQAAIQTVTITFAVIVGAGLGTGAAVLLHKPSAPQGPPGLLISSSRPDADILIRRADGEGRGDDFILGRLKDGKFFYRDLSKGDYEVKVGDSKPQLKHVEPDVLNQVTDPPAP